MKIRKRKKTILIDISPGFDSDACRPKYGVDIL